jgi:penicillin-binding protein 1A
MLSPKEPHNSPLFESDTINAQAAAAPPSPSAPHGRSRWLKLLIALTLTGLTIGVSSVGGLFWYYGRELPDFERLEGYAPPQMTRVYAHGEGEREGEELAAFYRARRTMVPQNQIAPVMVKALLAAEDADFYEHQGLDYWGMLRALYNRAAARSHSKPSRTCC